MLFAKLGPHVQLPSSQAFRFAQAAPVVKSIDNVGVLQAAPPGAITIFRHYFGGQDINRYGGDVARNVLDALGGYRPTYVELYNETSQRLHNGLDRYITLHEEAAPVIHAQGIGLAGFCFSTGNPEPEDWQHIQARGFGGVDVLAIHEYWGNQGLSTWNALRYRRVHEWLGGSHPPFVITETGRDQVEGGAAGWIASGVSAEQYLGELMAYDNAISQDWYVLGGTIFTAGPNGDWVNFNVDPLVDAIVGGGDPTPTCPPGFHLEGNICVPDFVPQPVPSTGEIPWWVFFGVGAIATGAVLLAATATPPGESYPPLITPGFGR